MVSNGSIKLKIKRIADDSDMDAVFLYVDELMLTNPGYVGVLKTELGYLSPFRKFSNNFLIDYN